jgi:hypothetical protein
MAPGRRARQRRVDGFSKRIDAAFCPSPIRARFVFFPLRKIP